MKSQKLIENFFGYLDAYMKLLWELFNYDVEVFSQVWIYAVLVIPAFAYFIFFLFKWIVLTSPVWLTILMVTKGFSLPFMLVGKIFAMFKQGKGQ